MNPNRKNAGSMWWLFYGKIEYKDDLLTVIMRLLKGHCFYIRQWIRFSDVFRGWRKGHWERMG